MRRPRARPAPDQAPRMIPEARSRLNVAVTRCIAAPRVFLPASLALFVIGFIKAMIDLYMHNSFGVGAAIAMVTAVQILGLGLLADLTIRRTRL